MNPFGEIPADRAESAALKEQIARHGYAMLRGLLCSDELKPLLNEITAILRDAGWLQSAKSMLRSANPVAACADGDSDYKPTRDKVFGLQKLHALLHHPALTRLMQMLVGDHLLVHPRPETRLVFPHYDRGIIHAHQDHTAVAGDQESFTAWIPLHDCPVVQGPLRILDGSHRFGLQATVSDTGYIPSGDEQGSGWVGGDINAGDVLLFHSLTVHEALPNLSDELRISIDFRFQSYDREVNPAVFVFTGSGARPWDRVYANWTSDELKYYWTKMPLRLKPSRSELIELSQSSTSPRLRERYSRILERLTAQMPNA